MKKTILAFTAAFTLSALSLHAEAPSKYQVTGPIVELTDTKIVVMKGSDKWELARSADTKFGMGIEPGAHRGSS